MHRHVIAQRQKTYSDGFQGFETIKELQVCSDCDQDLIAILQHRQS